VKHYEQNTSRILNQERRKKMKYTISFKRTVSKHSVLCLAVFIVFSVACDNTNSSNNSASRSDNTQGTPVPSISPSAPTNATATPSTNDSTKPTIAITQVPAKGAGETEVQTIAGTVGGVKIKDCKVVIFAYTNTWYVQPYIDSSDTSINEDNTWRNDTHLGSKYAALLVKKSYNPPNTTGKLPDVRDPVLAIATADAKQ
jgi:hypothetical protein